MERSRQMGPNAKCSVELHPVPNDSGLRLDADVGSKTDAFSHKY